MGRQFHLVVGERILASAWRIRGRPRIVHVCVTPLWSVIGSATPTPQGDSHRYLVDNPLALDNFTRIVVHGETLPFEYLRLTVDPLREPWSIK